MLYCILVRVLITIPTAGVDGNDRLSGIFRYLGENDSWDLRLPSSHLALTEEQLKAMLAEGLDGVLTSARFDPVFARLLTKAKIPVVALHDSYLHRREVGENFHFVLTDHVAVGRLAARHFLALGRFASYAYVYDTERNRWGRGRAYGFVRTLAQRGLSPKTFTPAVSPLRIIDRERFQKWIARLPRPIALFAANDRLASQAIGFCREMNLGVPADVAVLGVDNDRTFSAPAGIRLSTIVPDFPAAGFAAAEMLDQLMRRTGTVPRLRLFGPQRLIERDSTRPLPPSVRLVESALALIDSSDGALSVEDVARRLHVSRSLLDLRFRELGRGTVAAAIRAHRVAEVKRLLATTDDTIRKIGARCGFANEFALKNLFRKSVGLTMSDYRRQSAKPVT